VALVRLDGLFAIRRELALPVRAAVLVLAQEVELVLVDVVVCIGAGFLVGEDTGAVERLASGGQSGAASDARKESLGRKHDYDDDSDGLY